MTVYKSERINGFWHLVRNWIAGVLLLAIFTFLSYIIPEYFPFKNTNWLLLLIIGSIMQFISYIGDTWVNEVHIDPVKRKLLVKYYNFYEGKTSEVFTFDKLRIKINRRKLFNRSEANSISLIKGRSEEFNISRLKDGYSGIVLNSLAQHLETLTKPVDL